MELLTFTIGASESKRFEKAGRYLEIIDAAGPLHIDMNDGSGNRADSMRNALSGFYSEEPFSALEVTNPGAAQTVTLMITDRRGGSRRQPGVVSVIDGGRARTLSGAAFIGPGIGAAVAAQNAHVQLWNSNAATRRIVLKSVTISSSVAGRMHLRIHNTSATNFWGSLFNKNLGAALIPDAEIRFGSSVGLIGSVGLGFFDLQAGSCFVYRFEDPLILAPGVGVLAWHSALNADVLAVFDGYVEPIV